MLRFVSNSLSTDGSKLVAIDPTGRVLAWGLSRNVDSSSKSCIYSFPNPSSVLKGAKSFVEFLDDRFAVAVGGCIALILDVHCMLTRSETADSQYGDPAYLVQRVGLPCIAACVCASQGALLIGTSQGLIHRLGRDGRIMNSFRTSLSDTITAIRGVGENIILVGTDKGQILIFNHTTGAIISSWRSEGQPWSVSCISIDTRQNWFCAALNSGSKSRLISGSTRTLVEIFESQIREGEIQRCEFVQLASKGLCIVSTGPKCNITVDSLDLSSEPRTMHDGQGKVFDVSRSAQGDRLSICGAGRPVQILSGSSLAVIRQLVVE